MTDIKEFEKWLECIPKKIQSQLWLIPIKKNDKKPDVKDSWLDPANRLSIDEAKKRLESGLNVAFVAEPETLCVVDLDIYKRPELKDELFSIFPLTLTVETPSGGQHRYYLQDGKINNADGKGKFKNAGEVRANKKYVLVAGSEVNGKLYRVIEAGTLAILTDSLLPQEFKPTPVEIDVDKSLGEERSAFEEFENKHGWTLSDIILNDVALGVLLSQLHPAQYPSPSEADMAAISKLRFWEFDKKTIFDIMKRFRGRDKLSRTDYLERTYARAVPNATISTYKDPQLWHPNQEKLEEIVLKASSLRDGIVPPEALPQGSFLQEYYSTMSELTDAYPEFHLGCALVALSLVVGRTLQIKTIPHPKFCNVWILLIGASTYARKTTALSLLSSVLEYANLKDYKIAEDFSPEAFIEELADKPQALFLKDELAEFIVKLKRNYSLGIDALFANLYSCPQQYKRRLRRREFVVNNPYLCVLAATVPETFAKYMDEADLLTGFLPRFLLLMPERAKERKSLENISEENEQKLMYLASWLQDLQEYFDSLRETNKEITVQFKPEAIKKLDEWAKAHYQEFEYFDEVEKHRWGTIFGRLEEYAQKLACLVMLSRMETRMTLKPTNTVSKLWIQEDDVNCALLLIDNLFYPYAMKFMVYLGSKSETNIVERVALLMRQLRVSDRSSLLKKSKLKAKEFEEVLDTLQRRGDVRIIRYLTGGRIKEKIVWIGG